MTPTRDKAQAVVAELMPSMRPVRVPVGDGVVIHSAVGGRDDAPPLLLLHGHPQTHLIWHRVVPALAPHFRLVLADLRGSSRPVDAGDHATYSKRTMALDMLRVMHAHGHDRFSVLAHDRGARVTHRLAVDHPSAVQRMVLLDIAPTLAMYEGTSEAFARAYWHWFFLIQPAPLPERLIEADPRAYVRDVMGARPGGLAHFDPRALEAYQDAAAQPGSAHAMCEDYRSAAGIDLVHDRADRDAGRRLDVPLLALWGEHGVVHRCCDPLAEWRRVARDVQGQPLPSGHYIPEEAPQPLLDVALPFLRSSA